MTLQLVKEVSAYESAFRVFSETRKEPTWLRRLRQNSFEFFEHVGFPTVDEEEWKYTNLAPLARTNFEPVVSEISSGLTVDKELAPLIYDEARNSRVVFVNGVFQTSLSSVADLPESVVIIGIAEALGNPRYEAIIREHLTHGVGYGENGLTALNTALFSGAVMVIIPRGVRVEAPIHLLFLSEVNDVGPLASFPRVLFVAEENSEATLIESFTSPSEARYFTNAVIELVLGTGAHLRHYRVQRESTSALHVTTTNAELGAGASYDTTAINFGGALARHNVSVMMDHEGAECWVDGLYMIEGSQHTDTHSVIDHRQPHCSSHQLYKGILDGKSRAVFNGKVFVRHGAQQTDAQQTNKNLLLSNEARVDTKPQLEIFADDVKCAHGAAVGQLEEDAIFYLESRGIRPELARNLLTYGFAEEVIEKIKIDSIRRELDAAVLNRLHAQLEA